MHDGIDVSIWQGNIDWTMVRADGIRFAMIKATQGRKEDGKGYLFKDRYFVQNILGATSAGIYCGTYHYLTAYDESQAREEARYYLSEISPYREKHLLWAAVDVESDKYLPTDPAKLNAVVNAFCEVVNLSNFIPMVYTNPNYIRFKMRCEPKWDLWLAQWRSRIFGIPAGHPRLKIWQWGASGVRGINNNVDSDEGTFWLPSEDFGKMR